jgi:hypothetical protein
MTLLRLLLRLSLPLTMLFTGVLVAIRTQPYDDSEIRALLAPPDGCPAPCFLGIQPGHTTAEAAIGILKKHAWVGSVNINIDPVRLSQLYVSWGWSGRQPRLIDSQRSGFLWTLNENGTLRDKVSFVTVRTHLQFGDIWLAFGQPQRGQFYEEYRNGRIDYRGIYAARRTVIGVAALCPIESVWRLKSRLTFVGESYLSNQLAQFNPFPERVFRPCRLGK